MTSRKLAEGHLSSFGSEETQQNGQIVHTFVKNLQKYSWIDVNCLEYLPKTWKSAHILKMVKKYRQSYYNYIYHIGCEHCWFYFLVSCDGHIKAAIKWEIWI